MGVMSGCGLCVDGGCVWGDREGGGVIRVNG